MRQSIHGAKDKRYCVASDEFLLWQASQSAERCILALASVAKAPSDAL
jgi:hypothetical protein